MNGRIVVLVSGSGSNMMALAQACSDARIPGRVVAVVSDRACEGLERARQLGIETRLVDFSAFDSRAEWGEALRRELEALDPGLVVSAGFMRILPEGVVDAFYGKMINLHPSLLPAFPGAHGVRDALAAGVKVTGSTVHFVDREVDHGPIILQASVTVEEGDSEASLHDRIKSVEHRLLPEACRLLLEGRVRIEGGKAVMGADRSSPRLGQAPIAAP